MEQQLPPGVMHLGAGGPHRPHPGMDRVPPPSPSAAQPPHAGIMPAPNAKGGFSNTVPRPPACDPHSHATMAQTSFHLSAPPQQPVVQQTPFSRPAVQQAPAQQPSMSAFQFLNNPVGGGPIHPRQVQTQMPLLSQERNPRHGVEIIDLRHETMTEADARMLLSTYVIIRMQKSYNPNETDEIGNPMVPNWERITRAEQTEISQQEATRKVRDLDSRGPSVTNKKDDMPSPLQRQIEKAQERLQMSEEDNRYEYVLAQLDCKMREIDETSPLFNMYGSKKDKDQDKDKDKDRDKSKSKYKDRETNNKKTKKKGRDGDRDREKEKKGKSKESRKFERVSVTAYFRRIPRREVNAMKMFLEQQRFRGEQSAQPAARHMASSQHQQQMSLPPDQSPSQMPIIMPQQQQTMLAHHHLHQANPIQPKAPMQEQQQSQPQPARQMMPPPQPMHTLPTGSPVQDVRQVYPAQPQQFPSPAANRTHTANEPRGPHGTSHLNVRPPTERPSTPRVYEERPQSPGSSYVSDEDWESEGSECVTPESSIASSSRPGAHKRSSKSHSRRSDREEEFRHQLSRQHNKRDRDAAVPPRLPPIPPSSRPDILLPSSVDLDSIKEEAYKKGLHDAVASLQPLVVQNQRQPLSREVSSYEVRRAMQEDRLQEIGEALGRGVESGNRRPRGYLRDGDRRYNLVHDYFDHGRQIESNSRRYNELLEDLSDENDYGPKIRWVAAARSQSYDRHREGRAERHRLNPLAPAELYYRQ
ncbi:hypothetical protein E4U55_006717 [Claviceps digitariae]|nr:hypothetical protein E4U55_006717 [Claviceps digitariae]